jgi:hypothetical protein
VDNLFRYHKGYLDLIERLLQARLSLFFKYPVEYRAPFLRGFRTHDPRIAENDLIVSRGDTCDPSAEPTLIYSNIRRNFI